MDKTETHDFMNVESFSQLPFIRPAPSNKDKAIRLFGIEFGSSNTTATATTTTSTATTQDSSEPTVDPSATTAAASEEAKEAESGRKFECHYCCRNFPTSQALGGHQNAHKRERQHAKRAHLQSTLLHHADHHHHHMYGAASYVNYHHHRLAGSMPPPAPSSLHYPSWNSSSTATTLNSASVFGAHHNSFGSHHNSRYYGSHAASFSQAVPINGNPLATWRIPTVQPHPSSNLDRSSLHPLPLFASENARNSTAIITGNAASNGSSHQSQYVYDQPNKPNVQDHVSLDLHL